MACVKLWEGRCHVIEVQVKKARACRLTANSSIGYRVVPVSATSAGNVMQRVIAVFQLSDTRLGSSSAELEAMRVKQH